MGKKRIRNLNLRGLVYFLVLLSLSFITGCKQTFHGTLSVPFDFRVLIDEEEHIIPADRYKAALKVKKRQIELQIEMGEDEKLSVEIELPSDSALPPKEKGNFSYSKEETGQPFSIQGEVFSTKHSQSEVYRDVEGCEYDSYEYVCYGRGCRYEYVRKSGFRDVEYYFEYTLKWVSCYLMPTPNGLETAAYLSGEARVKDKIYEYEGPCF